MTLIDAAVSRSRTTLAALVLILAAFQIITDPGVKNPVLATEVVPVL